MNIAIIDDSKQVLEQLNTYVQAYFSRHKIFRIVDTYLSGESFLEKWGEIPYDLVFLDIIMQGLSGIEVARKIREHNSDCLIIFISASREYAIQGFSVRAFDYLLKPLSKETFDHTMSLCHAELKKRIRYIEVKESRIMIKVSLNSILYTDYYNHYIQIHTTDRVIRSYQNFETFSPLLLCFPQFICCYRNCIVNMEQVSSLTQTDFVLENKEHIPILKSQKQMVHQKYMDYQFIKTHGGFY